ncbi:arylacetamide deacetylase-like 4 [Salvelinus namaycush]|uniref:Arylacetamide deacetylase-like 4 n=1 Tax=Salvelinus namaycush TaxID=8040 RepID=A0A8U1H791_SALNM|nr:arylacetamide deacetylase-like 4 [Salvelinus namaycush]
MDISTAILIIGFAAVIAAFFLLVIGLMYSEMMNSDIPQGVANRGKLHVVHGLFVGISIVGRILDRLGLCHQVRFTRWFRRRFLVHIRPVPPGLRVKDLTFSEVPVRVYEPTTGSLGLRRGLVYFHGGGWVLGCLDTADDICRHIAKEAETTVISVGYRLAPEHRYPTQLDDCDAATCHFLSVAEAEFGVDPGRVAVGGDSAGGNLAAALCQRLAKRKDGHLLSPCAQVLIYPALQMADFNLPSYQQNHAVPILFRGRVAFYFLQYLNGDTSVCQDLLEGNHIPAEMRLAFKEWLSPEHLPPECKVRGELQQVHSALDYNGEVYHKIKAGLDPEVSPLLAEDAVIRLTPPAFILTCEYDVLRDDGILYRKRLLDLGLDVTWYHVPDGFHGLVDFFKKGWLTFPSATQAINSIVSYVKTL